MAIQKFSLTALQKVRQFIQQALVLPDSVPTSLDAVEANSAEDLPEPESLDQLSGLFNFSGVNDSDILVSLAVDQWTISTVNPAAALMKLPGLKLKPDLRLVSYVYRAEQDGIGVVWALPEPLSTTAQLEKALASSTSISQIPKPAGALSNFMEAIEGDRSPGSFMIASLLRRELQEFGALGNRCQWLHHHLMDSVPPKLNWKWRLDLPKDFSPKVKLLPNDQAAVEFFTYRRVSPTAIYRHVDQYPAEQYKPNCIDQVIAIAQS